LLNAAEPRRDRDALDGDVGRRRAMDAPEIAQMGGAGGDCALTRGLGSRAATTTGQAFLLEKGVAAGGRVFALCSHFLNISTMCQGRFLIFMIAYVLKSRIIKS
jgi:hypothetical protein